MYRFYLAAVDMLPAALILLPVYWVLNRACLHHAGTSILYYLFSCYLSVVYVLVGLPNITYIRPELNLNLIPFLGLFRDLESSVLNILLFIPLGMALPILWKTFRRLQKTLLLGFGISLAIELLQILTFRTTDVNDLITNTLGTGLGFLIARFLLRRFPKLLHAHNSAYVLELKVLLSIVLLVMFFLYPFASAALWNFLL